jgi:hypothetical protein
VITLNTGLECALGLIVPNFKVYGALRP